MKLFKHITSLLTLAALLSLVAFSSIVPSSVADVTGDGSSHAVASSGTARWIQFVALSANSAVVRVGDSNVSTSRGIPIAAGGGWLMPPIPVDQNQTPADRLYNLNSIFYLAQSGDKLSIVWGQ